MAILLGAGLLIPACSCTDRYVYDSDGHEHHHPCKSYEKCCRPQDPRPCSCSQACPCWEKHH